MARMLLLIIIEKVADVGGRTAGQNLHGVSTNDTTATDYIISDLYSLVKTYEKDFHAVEARGYDQSGEPEAFP